MERKITLDFLTFLSLWSLAVMLGLSIRGASTKIADAIDRNTAACQTSP